MTPVEIHDDTIKLGQLLQLAGIVDGGAEAKHLVASGEVAINGEPETRRGRKVRPGDVVTVGGVEVQVVRA